MSGINRYPCCEETFPYTAEIFEICLPESISSLYETPREYFMPGLAGKCTLFLKYFFFIKFRKSVGVVLSSNDASSENVDQLKILIHKSLTKSASESFENL